MEDENHFLKKDTVTLEYDTYRLNDAWSKDQQNAADDMKAFNQLYIDI